MFKRSRNRSFKLLPLLAGIWLFVATVPSSYAVVMYDEGREFIDGVTLLRDKDTPSDYYYLPTSPRVAIDEISGKPEISIVKFISPDGDTSGGLLHLLFSLDLPEDRILDIEEKLGEKVPGAKLKGPVVLRAEGDKDRGGASFRVISSTITEDAGQASFTKSMISSGFAPVTPGSKAAVAARLSENGATLLWSSMERPTSDISIAISASYEAALPAFRGKVFANIETVYDHMFRVLNLQEGYQKTEIRKQIDEMVREGVIEIDITDRAGLEVDSSQLSGILSLVTDKLVNMMFDTSQGLSKMPEQKKIPPSVIKGRQKRGFLARIFAGSGNQKYITDDQFTLRTKKDIKRGTFSMLFNQNTTIRVPFNSTGNMSGLYEEWGDDPDLFKVVSLNDPGFQRRDVFFEVDPAYYQAFEEGINSVSVSFVKRYPSINDQADFTGEVLFNRNDVRDGKFSKSVSYPRLGVSSNDWLDYEYRVLWSFPGGKRVAIPEKITDLGKNNAPSVSLTPPAQMINVEIDGDVVAMNDANIRRAMVEFEYRLLGEKKNKSVALKPGSEDILQTIGLLHDRGLPIRYRVRWFSKRGVVTDEWQELEGEYLFLVADVPDTPEVG